jgi:DnaJ-class molecular chaperone
MTITIQTCSMCDGRGRMEQFQERFGDDWAPERGTAGMPDWARADLWIALLERLPRCFRWAEVECPSCHGRGEYDVEYVTCRIF